MIMSISNVHEGYISVGSRHRGSLQVRQRRANDALAETD